MGTNISITFSSPFVRWYYSSKQRTM